MNYTLGFRHLLQHTDSASFDAFSFITLIVIIAPFYYIAFHVLMKYGAFSFHAHESFKGVLLRFDMLKELSSMHWQKSDMRVQYGKIVIFTSCSDKGFG